MLIVALLVQYKLKTSQVSIKKLNSMMEYKAVIKKNEEDLNMQIWKYSQDDKANCRMYCTTSLTLTKCICTHKCRHIPAPFPITKYKKFNRGCH